ncbi:MAG: PDZ domain-containing protein [Bdellovibrionales bacterium]|nr:PDZ domain-containing protein [Bdellovibrionales bacterium]MBT3525089.1 PDZ domain-containing protein [Bdellovibrionales bacterium]
MKNETSDFCMKQFKPVVGLVLALLLIVIGWTIYIEMGYGNKAKRASLHHGHGAGAQQVAMVKIPLTYNAIMRHVYRGNRCRKCHTVTGVATPPRPFPVPIAPKAPMRHPYWGKCVKCHKFTGGATNAVAFLGVAAKPATTGPNAGKIPIMIGSVMTHTNYGNNCEMCHFVPGGDQKPAIPSGPIKWSIPLPHPYWGACKKCHPIMKTPGAPVAFVNSRVGKNIFGASLITVDPQLARQFNLPRNDGVLVNGVEPKSFAATIGLLEGDILIMIDADPITSLDDLSRGLAKHQIGDRVTMKVTRNKRRTKNLKFTLKEWTAAAADPMNRVGILATGQGLNSPVAHSLVNAPYLIVYEVDIDNFYAIANPFKGMPDNKVSSWVSQKHVGSVIVGNIKNGELLNFNQNGIKVFSSVVGSARDAVALFRAGELVEKRGTQVVAFNRNMINTVLIPANYADPASNIAPDFDSAQYFIKVALDQNKYEILANPSFGMPKADGVMAAHFLVDNDADLVIANRISSPALVELKKLNIHVIKGVDMGVGDAILSYENGNL